jgi:hypothetical protein
MADHTGRILASHTDVMAVEHHAPGMCRVVTVSDCYTVDARHETCQCPDYEYNLDGQGRCKHLYAALRETDQLPTETVVGLDESLSERVATDGGHDENPREDCWCADSDLPCFDHFTTEDNNE